MPYWGFLRKNVFFGYFSPRIIKNTIAIFEITTLNFIYLQSFVKKKKGLNFVPKLPLLGILGPEFEKNIVII